MLWPQKLLAERIVYWTIVILANITMYAMGGMNQSIEFSEEFMMMGGREGRKHNTIFQKHSWNEICFKAMKFAYLFS